MEDDLKLLKVEYLSNHFLDHTQILNLDDQTIFLKSSKWRRTPMKDNLKNQKWNITTTTVWIVNEFLVEN